MQNRGKEVLDIPMASIANLFYMSERFPGNPFQPQFKSFRFFDADWLLDRRFVEVVDNFRERVYMSSLDEGMPTEALKCIELRPGMPPQRYAELVGGDSSDSWLGGADRLVSWPISKRWCIYGERRAEIAAIAFPDYEASLEQERALGVLKAVPLEEAIARQWSYGFTERALSPEWKKRMLLLFNK